MEKKKTGLTVQKLEENVANHFIEMLEKDGLKGVSRWRVPAPPRNGLTGHVYRGGNVLATAISMMVNGFEDTRFVTFKQAKTLGGKVRKGQRGTAIKAYDRFLPKGAEDAPQNYRNFAKILYVWNVEQCDDIDHDKLVDNSPPVFTVLQRNEAAEAFISASGAKIDETGTSAFYTPLLDKIVMPPRESFVSTPDVTSMELFYSTLLHELVHWTGHNKRLDRLTATGRQSKSYAFEELVAEIGSVMLGIHTGVQTMPREDNAQYVQSWIRKLKKDPSTIFSAATDASKAMTFLVDLQPANEREFADEHS